MIVWLKFQTWGYLSLSIIHKTGTKHKWVSICFQGYCIIQSGALGVPNRNDTCRNRWSPSCKNVQNEPKRSHLIFYYHVLYWWQALSVTTNLKDQQKAQQIYLLLWFISDERLMRFKTKSKSLSSLLRNVIKNTKPCPMNRAHKEALLIHEKRKKLTNGKWKSFWPTGPHIKYWQLLGETDSVHRIKACVAEGRHCRMRI